MKKNVAAFALLLMTFNLGFPTTELLATKAHEESDRLILKSYHVSHMPVWTIDHNFDENMLVSYLQACATPKLWKARGGTASIQVYKQNLKIVVSGNARTHRAIERALDRFPRPEEPAPLHYTSN